MTAKHRPTRTRNVARRLLDPPRLVAWQLLRAVAVDDAYANLVLPRLLRDAGLTGRDAAFTTELGYGTLRGRGSYDAVLAACVDRPLDQVDPALLDALRLGTHQLLAMRVPAHAAVDATVDLVRAEVGQGAAGFANAVLRKVAGHDLAQWFEQVAPARADDLDGHLSVTTSHPRWIVRALRDALSQDGHQDELETLLAADNTPAAVALAALPGLCEPADLLAEAERNDDVPHLRLGTLSPRAVLVRGTPDAVPAVRSGTARVQDEASQLVTLLLTTAALPGDDQGRWLDLCAGPGGKAALLAAVLGQRRREHVVPPTAQLLANESAPHRVELVRRSLAGVQHRLPDLVQVQQGDGRDIGPVDGFDRVLVDVPCTGLGALRRRPEARWRRSPADLASLGPLQRELLTAAVAAVRPGGLVAYVTCSPHPAETRLVVADVVRAHPGLLQVDAAAAAVELLGGANGRFGSGPDLMLWPHRHGGDAMYLALLRKP
jgi:16S rRNA (cytosine967-C5)-methyltransferase